MIFRKKYFWIMAIILFVPFNLLVNFINIDSPQTFQDIYLTDIFQNDDVTVDYLEVRNRESDEIGRINNSEDIKDTLDFLSDIKLTETSGDLPDFEEYTYVLTAQVRDETEKPTFISHLSIYINDNYINSDQVEEGNAHIRIIDFINENNFTDWENIND